MVTIYDVAERAQVSPGTVSRVINNHPSVRPVTRRAVLAAIEELRYQPNQIARTLRTAKTRMLGLVAADLQSGAGLIGGLWGAEAAAKEHGYALLLADSQKDPEIEARNVTELLGRRVDGLLCNPVVSSRAIADLVAGSDVPTVIWGWTVVNRVLPSVVFSEIDAMREAVGHLVEVGHRRIGVLLPQGPRGLGGAFRQQEFRDVLSSFGIAADAASFMSLSSLSPDECGGPISALLRSPARPTALIVARATLVPGVLIGVREAGLRVPDDLSLISVGDADWMRATTPPLNVVTLQSAEHLEAATRLVIGLIERRAEMPKTITQRSQYLRRGSVQPPPPRSASTASAGPQRAE